MTNTITPRHLEVKYSGLAVECGTLAILTQATIHQHVLVMPLTRIIERGSLMIHQWVIHVTMRSSTKSPVYYATLRAAEVVQSQIAVTLTAPYVLHGEDIIRQAQKLQVQLQHCVVKLLTQNVRVSDVVTPARFRLPDEWVWSAQCQTAGIVCRDGAWVLVDEVPYV